MRKLCSVGVLACAVLVSGCGRAPTHTMADMYDNSVDATWTNSMSDGDSKVIQSFTVTRTATRFYGVQTGCDVRVAFTLPTPGQLSRLRLVYTCADGVEVVADDASEENGRIGATDTTVVIDGHVPWYQTSVRLMATMDGHPEQPVYQVGP